MIRVLGDYNVIKQIGQGSLGTVYLAEHRFMKCQYVLKVLPEEFALDRGFIQRFEEEIGVLSKLTHPNIVKVHNVSSAQGLYFLVTDCVVDSIGETTNLAQYLISRDRVLQEDEIFIVLRQVADALDYAHSKKMGEGFAIHRGLKLNNILVGHKKEQLQIILSDFGLSRIVGTGAVLSRTYKTLADALSIPPVVEEGKNSPDRYTAHTVDTQKLSTLHSSFLQNYVFLAPEQKNIVNAANICLKADVYAFGVLAYHLLTQEFPEGIFEFPSEKVSKYRMDWDSLILACLQKNPEKRPSLLLELVEKLAANCEKPSYLHKAPSSSVSMDNSSFFHEEKEMKQELPGNTEDAGKSVYAKAEDLSKNSMFQEISLKKDLSPTSESLRKGLSPYVPGDGGHAHNLKPVLQTQELQRPKYDPDPAQAIKVNTTVKQYHPEPKEPKNVEPILTDMVVIKGGTFYRGCSDGNRDEMPKHQIVVASFALDIHPVTNEQFVRFLAFMGGEKDSNNQDIIRLRESRIKRSGGKINIESGYAKHPVVGVTWYGAVAYAKWIGKRLPKESEWEVATKEANSNLIYPTGDDIEKSQANFFSSDTTVVMSYAPNSLGIYDMAGNVYEWCQDWYGYNYYSVSAQEPDNPEGPLQGVYRVLRGGCWKSLKEDLRCSHRHRNNPGTVNRTYGFRCTADVE